MGSITHQEQGNKRYIEEQREFFDKLITQDCVDHLNLDPRQSLAARSQGGPIADSFTKESPGSWLWAFCGVIGGMFWK